MGEYLPSKLESVRHGLTFADCLYCCAREPYLVENFDRLHGTNLSLKGAPLDLAIDQATGRLDSDMEKFIEFCWEFVFLLFGE